MKTRIYPLNDSLHLNFHLITSKRLSRYPPPPISLINRFLNVRKWTLAESILYIIHILGKLGGKVSRERLTTWANFHSVTLRDDNKRDKRWKIFSFRFFFSFFILFPFVFVRFFRAVNKMYSTRIVRLAIYNRGTCCSVFSYCLSLRDFRVRKKMLNFKIEIFYFQFNENNYFF